MKRVWVFSTSEYRHNYGWLTGDDKVVEPKIDPVLERLYQFRLDVLKHRENCKNARFTYRVLRHFDLIVFNLVSIANSLSVKNQALFTIPIHLFKGGHLDAFFQIVGIICDFVVQRFLADPILAHYYDWWFENNTPVESELEAALRGADVLLVPTQAADVCCSMVTRIGKRLGIPVIALVDNWDNLTSKSVFDPSPDYITVIGEQGMQEKEHYPNSKFSILGSPRFRYYYPPFKAEIIDRGYDYWVFGGCSVPYDEVSFLMELDELLEKYNETRGRKLKIVYRPHPWRIERIKEPEFREDCFSSTFKESIEGMPDYQELLNLLGNSLGVITPFSTLIIEAGLLGKPVIGLMGDDGIHFTSPVNSVPLSPHFEPILNTGLIEIGKTPEEVLSKMLKDPTVLGPVGRKTLEYIISSKSAGYKEHLDMLIEKIKGN